MNSENKNNCETNDIMKNINQISCEKECSDTGKIWKKNCPKCGEEQFYSSYNSLRLAKLKNTMCNPCRASVKKIIPENGVWKRICKKCGKEMTYSCRRSFNIGKRTNSKCRKCAIKESSKTKDYSWMRNVDYRMKISNSMKLIRKSDRYGESFKEKCRKNKAKWVSMGVGSKPNYNRNACQFINALNQRFGWTLQHAENGGEISIGGFFVDGYDLLKNIVFEYDEPKHHTLSHEKKDRIKQKVIITKINPLLFLRYDEKNKKLYDVITMQEYK